MTRSLNPDALFQMAHDYIHPDTLPDKATLIHPLFTENHNTLVHHYAGLQNLIANKTGIVLQPLVDEYDDPLDFFYQEKTPAETLFQARQDMLADIVLAAPGHHRFAITANSVQQDRHEQELLAAAQSSLRFVQSLKETYINYFAWGDIKQKYEPYVHKSVLMGYDEPSSDGKNAATLQEFLEAHSSYSAFLSQMFDIRFANKTGLHAVDKQISPACLKTQNAVMNSVLMNMGVFLHSFDPESLKNLGPDHRKNPDDPNSDSSFRFPMN